MMGLEGKNKNVKKKNHKKWLQFCSFQFICKMGLLIFLSLPHLIFSAYYMNSYYNEITL